MRTEIKNEWDEVLRTIEELKSRGVEVRWNNMMMFLQDANIITLNDYVWERLENTESNEIEKGDYKKLSEICKKHHKKRWRRLFLKILLKRNIQIPMIVSYDTDKYYLISGNTRLCINKVLGRKPKVIFATI